MRMREGGMGWKETLRGALALAIILGLSGGGLSGCRKPEKKPVKPPVVNVQVREAETRSLRPFVESVGSLNPYDTVSVSSELDGILDSVRVSEGDAVKAGQAIAEIRKTDYQLALTQARASLKQSQASLTNTALEYERKAALYREELVTRQQFDDVTARLALAQADLERAKATLALAEERLAKTRIASPMGGQIKEKRVTTGDYVRNGTFLVSIIRTDRLKLVFSISEKELGSLKVGQDLVFTVDAFPEVEFAGRLNTIYAHLDERTRALQVEAVVPNADGRLKPGLFARVTLYTGPARKRVIVPITALLYDKTTTKLFVVQDGKARERQVRVGHKYGEVMEIVDGVREKEIVVTVGQNNLMEGVQVHVDR